MGNPQQICNDGHFSVVVVCLFFFVCSLKNNAVQFEQKIKPENGLDTICFPTSLQTLML